MKLPCASAQNQLSELNTSSSSIPQTRVNLFGIFNTLLCSKSKLKRVLLFLFNHAAAEDAIAIIEDE
jgi:hypothetical protein